MIRELIESFLPIEMMLRVSCEPLGLNANRPSPFYTLRSNHERNPARPHSLHVGRVLRIVAKEVSFDEALNRNEPKHLDAHQ